MIEISSDYGSGENSPASGSQDMNWATFHSNLQAEQRQKAASYADLMTGRCTLQDVMQDFRMNGSDSPYNPDDELWRAPSAVAPYGRQQSWPGRQRPTPRALRPQSLYDTATSIPRASDIEGDMLASASSVPYGRQQSWPGAERPQPRVLRPMAGPSDVAAVPPSDALTDDQRRVLNSLSDETVLALLREMQRKNKKQNDECRFCKNNGERESFFRSHTVKDAAGRVACPVLRAFHCRRCGASGDAAHTIKYCPLSSAEERFQATAIMQSIRRGPSRRRRAQQAPSVSAADNYVYFGETPSSVIEDNNVFNAMNLQMQLDPLWAELEQKLGGL